MAEIVQLLDQAKAYHRDGHLQTAEQLYREALSANAANPEVLYLLGAACYGLGKFDEASTLLEKAVRLAPSHAETRHLFGAVLAQQDRLDEAILNLQEAWRLKPHSSEISKHLHDAMAARSDKLGVALTKQGRPGEAIHYFQEALRAQPNYVAALGNLGNAFKNAAKLDEAEACYRRLLALVPQSAQPHNDLGLIAQARGKIDEAISHYRRALELDANFAEAHTNLGTALTVQGKYLEAEACCRQALKIRPDFAEAHTDLGNVLTKQKRFDEALAACKQAVALNPTYSVVHNNVGIVFKEQQRFGEAEASFRRALELQPRYPQAHNNLGVVLAEQGKFDEAVACYQRALDLLPNYIDARYNLGIALTELSKFDEAVSCYHQVLERKHDHLQAYCNLCLVLLRQRKHAEAESAGRRLLELHPQAPLAHGNLGDIFADQQKFDDAAACYARALKADPTNPQTYNSLAVLSLRQNKLDEAADYCAQALAIDNEHADAHFTTACIALVSGRFSEGWPEYEWRFKRKGRAEGSLPKPRWDGSPLEGRTILLRCEQGLGDMIQFARYAELVKQRGGTVLIESQPQLASLLASCPGVDQVVIHGQPLPEYDCHLPLMSLPWIFETSLETIPAKAPYLWPDPQSVARWKEELSAEKALHVGIAWRGSASQLFDSARSIPLKQFARLARLPGLRLYSLQTGFGREELTQLGPDSPIIDLGDRVGDFRSTAAVVASLDLVITCDSSPAHLAGAVGQKVWVPLPVARDWRWMQERSDSPWYPTMRLFRQTTAGDWDGVFQRIADELADLARVWAQESKHDEAKARRDAGDDAETHFRQGVALTNDKKWVDAEMAYKRALSIQPQYAEAHNNLGLVLREQGNLDEAVMHLRRYVELQPRVAMGYSNLCQVLLQQRKYAEAETVGRQLLELDPQSALAHGNLGDIFADQQKFDEATACYTQALKADPRNPQTYNCVADLALKQNKLEEAADYCAKALAINPEHAETHFTKACLALVSGRFAEGWSEYEWRFKRKGRAEGSLPKPRWDGSPLEGRTILLRCEQGFGDTIQFVRYAELVKQRGGKVVVESQPQLASLLASCPGVDQVVALGQPLPEYDCHLPLMSLPWIFETSLKTIPAKVPYLWPDPQAVARWKEELSTEKALHVGIAWRGSASQLFDSARSIPFKQFARLARLPGLRLYSLQTGFGREELTQLGPDSPIIDLGDRVGDFRSTAAVVASLDLVITCDSSPAHLAGAIGQKVWVPLPVARDWRWMQERSDSPWYPTMRLFRQTTAGDWDGVFQRIADELADLV